MAADTGIKYVRLQGVLELAAAIASTRGRRPHKTTSTERRMVSPALFETGLNIRDWPVILAKPSKWLSGIISHRPAAHWAASGRIGPSEARVMREESGL